MSNDEKRREGDPLRLGTGVMGLDELDIAQQRRQPGVHWTRHDDPQAYALAGRGPKGYRRPAERIAEDVNEALTRNELVDAYDVVVRVEGEVAILEGSVPDRLMKWVAEDLAAGVSGVREVENRLRVRPYDEALRREHEERLLH